MLASLLLLSLCLFLSVFVPSVVAQTATTQFGFCFTNTNKPGSPYGPWSVATSGVLTVNSTLYFVTKQPTTGGGQRYGYDVLSATGSRTQLNRDGSTSSATLGLCPNGKQGSDNVVYNSSSPTSDSFSHSRPAHCTPHYHSHLRSSTTVHRGHTTAHSSVWMT